MTKRAGKNKKKSPAASVPNESVETTAETAGHKAPTENEQPIATGDSLPTPMQSAVAGMEDSVFWRELRVNDEKAKELWELRYEIRAVKESWPVPRPAKERAVAEAAKILMSSDSAVKHKLEAMRLLHLMDRSNRDDLPIQVELSAKPSDVLDRQSIAHEIARSSVVLEAIDFRPIKTEDYLD